MTGRLISKREYLGSCSDASAAILEIGEVFAKDFVLLAVVQTSNLMVNGLLQYI
jgi:hypothetical protein